MIGFNKEMDIGESTTVTKLNVQGEGDNCYLLIGWHLDSFEMYLFNGDKLWRGRFSRNRLAGFSRNLNVSEVEYFDNTKKCLSQTRHDCCYELRSGFFYWKRKYNNELVMEGFLPMELDESPKHLQPNLVDVLLALNSHFKDKVNGLKHKFENIKLDYQKCLKDTEEFLSLKIDMEKALCTKFLSLMNIKKSQIEALQLTKAIKDRNTEESLYNEPMI